MNQSQDSELEALLHRLYGSGDAPKVDDDFEFQVELAKVLEEPERNLANIPAERRAELAVLVDRMTSKRPRSKARWVSVAAAIASIAAAAAWLVVSRPAAPTGPFDPVVTTPATLRGDSASRPPPVPKYGPDTLVEIRFTMPLPKNGIEAVTLRVFILENGRLEPVEPTITKVRDRNQVSFEIEGVARSLFGMKSGPKTLLFAFAGPHADTGDLDGLSWEVAQQRDGIAWAQQRLEYEIASGALEATLFHYARLLGPPGGTIPIFDREFLPVIRVRGAQDEVWSVHGEVGGKLIELATQA